MQQKNYCTDGQYCLFLILKYSIKTILIIKYSTCLQLDNTKDYKQGYPLLTALRHFILKL